MFGVFNIEGIGWGGKPIVRCQSHRQSRRDMVPHHAIDGVECVSSAELCEEQQVASDFGMIAVYE